MESKLKRLKQLLAEIADIQAASALLDWDQQTYMPPGGVESRGDQLSTLDRIAHIKSTSPEIGNLLDDLQPYAEQLDPDSDDARLIKVARRKYEKKVKVSPDLIADLAKASATGTQSWAQARKDNNFKAFQPDLEKIVDLRRQIAQCFGPYDHIYDPLLDEFEPGLKTADVQEIFTSLLPQQVELIQKIKQMPQVDNSFLHQPFDEQKQWDFGVKVITEFGYDWNRGRQDKSPHPFTTSFGIDDVRITTRVRPDFFNPAIFGTMHEAGHAMYEMGIDHALARTPLAEGASLAIHESQSRMWENLVGRSLPFWEHFYPQLIDTFPEQLAAVDLETFYKGINKVEPTFIRVEADEATYNLHIMLRLDLEIALIEGSLEVKDLPDAWNERMETYMGITPQNDADGVLQDVHWSGGMIGYFSTYALGNLVASQLWEKINEDIPDLSIHVQSGAFSTLLAWLRKNIHRHGAKFEPQELVQRVTGEKINARAYMRYLNEKYQKIYGF